MRRFALFVFMALAASAGFAQEVPNPFTAQGARPREGFFHFLTSNVSAFVSNAMAPVQKTLNESLASITRSLQGSRSLGGLLFVALISLVYGMFHAAGPGHGKTIVSSFFLANEVRLRHSIAVGYLIAAVHSMAALSVVLVLYYLVRGLFSTGIEQANHYIQLATFAVIAVLGAVMLIGRIRGTGHHHHAHGHAPDRAGGVTFRNLLGIAVPAGMGVTISVTGALVILAKQGTLKALAAGREERDSRLRRAVEIGGAAVLFLFGLVFFLAQL